MILLNSYLKHLNWLLSWFFKVTLVYLDSTSFTLSRFLYILPIVSHSTHAVQYLLLRFFQKRFLFRTCAYSIFSFNIRLKNLSRGVECDILLGTACHFRMLFSKSTSEPYVQIVWNHNLTSPLRDSIHNQNCSLMVRSVLEKENAVVWNIYIGGNYSSPLSSEPSIHQQGL